MPIACSLDGNDRKDRLDWVEQLSRRSLRSVTRSDLTLDLTHAAEALSDVRELVAREQECCTFLSFDLRHDAKGVHLRITAPEQAREVAAELFAYFAPKLAPEVTQ